jgi:hypothetical protein
MFTHRSLLLAALLLPAALALPAAAAQPVFHSMPPAFERASGLGMLTNLDYSNGVISTFSVASGQATEIDSFRVGSPAKLQEAGIAIDPSGLIYTAIDASGKPCVACVEVLQPKGTLVAQIEAPILGSLQPEIDDISLDGAGRVYVADYGQMAAYFFSPSGSGFSGPTMIASGTNISTVAVSPNGKLVFLSGDCGFASVRIYTKTGKTFQAGNCFGIGTIALIGGSADDAGDVATPVDGVRGLVSISNANGNGGDFSVPDPQAELGSVVFSSNAALLYVADHKHNRVYAFARPNGGWVSGTAPALAATYTGFKQLDITAIPL